ncbi:unnamed protein product [Rotaria magnacalcarata]|uniref:Chloride channel CLIC-like protein 1 n=4 Tax=Rotaria magnacalcarata TaxID=392030 RepID=A0A815S718_9BILA|nr:unnamed protein product [Rotaria magnacalcarata]CAF1486273.1 unnamed protein product [Rotaria magnacalcarata]CAF2004148.1 unnamed protein product [Rotaria magnacalcarata]
MFNNAKDQVAEKVKEKVQKHILNVKDDQTCSATFKTEYRTVLTAYRQMVKDLLEKFPSKDAKEYRIFLELSSHEFDRLNQFASKTNYEHKDVLHEVHMISDLLKRLVYKVEEDRPIFSNLTWSIWLRSCDINLIIKYILIMIMIGAISFISIRSHLRRGRWLTTFVIVGFVVSVIQNWYTLYQEAQAKVDEVLMKKIPKHCQGHPLGVWDYVKSGFGRFFLVQTNECLEYHKALRATPHSQVTPVQAVSMTFAQLFVTPLGAIGESLSQFFAGTMRHVPMVLWPLIITIILFIVIVLILMYSRYEVHLPFMMGSLRPSPHAPVAMPPPPAAPPAIADVDKLENRIKQLELQLEEKNRALEYNATSPVRSSRSSSIEKQSQQRERSSSIRRVQIEKDDEHELQQRITTTNIGFRKDFLPD